MGLGLVALCLSISLGAFLLLERSGQDRKRLKATIRDKPLGTFYQRVYPLVMKTFLTGPIARHLRARFELIGQDQERNLRKRVVQATLMIEGVMILLIGLTLVTLRDIFSVLLMFIFLWFLSQSLVDFFVVRVKNRLLRHQLHFNDLLRHKYYESNMVDDSLYEATQALLDSEHEMAVQGARLYDILTAKDPGKAILDYNETAPNKYLKMLAALAHMTMEYGDVFLEGKSIFMKNLSDLSAEIRIELVKRERLNYALKSLNIIVLLPLFFMTPIRNWASSSFEPLELFYQSQTGYLLRMGLLMVIFVAYLLLRKIQQLEDETPSYVSRKGLEEWLYTKYLSSLIDYIKPNTAKERRQRAYLKKIGMPMTYEGFITRKFLAALIAFFLCLMLLFGMTLKSREEIMNQVSWDNNFLGGHQTETEKTHTKAIIEQEKALLRIYKGQLDQGPIREALQESSWYPLFEEVLRGKNLNGQEPMEVFLNDLAYKEKALGEVGLPVGSGFILLISIFVGFKVPDFLAWFQGRLIAIEIENEVSGFYQIVLMLMHHERLSVTELIEWLGLFSSHFRGPLEDCINDASLGLYRALETLESYSNHERFIRLVEGLKLASMDITIRQAFDELEADKSFYLEERKQDNERMIERKVNLGQMIGFLPIYALIIAYLIIPMIVTSLRDMERYYQQLQIGG